MNIRLVLCLYICFVFCSFLNAQIVEEEDVIILKNGSEYTGKIVEQRPGKSLKLKLPVGADTLVFYMEQIDIIKKRAKSNNNSKSSAAVNSSGSNSQDNSNYPIGNDLIIFSEQGYKFVLYINGKKTSEEFSTEVTIENIYHNWIKIAVLFEDPDKGVIEQMIRLSSSDDFFIPCTNTYLVRERKDRSLVLFELNESPKSFLPGANVLIHRDRLGNDVFFQYQNIRYTR